MKKRRKASTRQGVLFSPIADEQVLSHEYKSQAVSALADLLLEAVGVAVNQREGREDESEDHD